MTKLDKIHDLLQSEDEETRRVALHSLQGLPLHQITGPLFAAMGDTSWRVRKEAVELLVAAAPDQTFIGEVLDLLRNEGNAGLRNSAAEAVVRLGNTAIEPLIALSTDPDQDVRKQVIDIMGNIGDPAFVMTLLVRLKDPDVNVAAAAAEHLGQLGESAVIPDLIDSIVSNSSSFFRFSALVALGKLNSHMPIPQEIIRLADQELLRKSVFECLGSIGDHTAAPILLNGFSAPHKSQRKAAVAAWYRIFCRSSATVRQAMEESLAALKGSEVLPGIFELFRSEDVDFSEAVTAIIGIIGDTRGIDTLLSACSNERLAGVALTSFKHLGAEGIEVLVALYPGYDETNRATICSLIGALGYGSKAALIRKALSDPFPSVRKAAVTAAGRLALIDCIPVIAELLADPDGEVRNAVVSCLQVLALLDPAAVRQVAVQLGTSGNPVHRRSAATLYATAGDHSSLSLLVKDEDPGVRQAAVVSIGKLNQPAHNGLLRLALVDEDPDVRIAAAEALGETGGREELEALIHAVSDQDCWVQCAALRSVTRLDRSRALSAIAALLPGADGLLGISCLELLETIGTNEALDLVEGALESEDKEVVSLAIAILSRQGGEWIIENSERISSHPVDRVRLAWVEVLAALPEAVSRPLLHRLLQREPEEPVRSRVQSLLEALS